MSYAYGYAAMGGCGADPNAGNDSARTSETVTINGDAPTTTTSCTDYASRLTSASGANPLSSVTYNGHGDATTVGGQTITYDASDRVASIASSAGDVTQSVTYSLDPTNRLVTRVAAGTGTGAENSTTVYGYTGSGDSADLQLDSTGTLAERYLSLPGGVLLTHRYTTTGGDVWSTPDLHGDIIATTDATGALTSSGTLYDLFGDPIDPTSGVTNPAATPVTRTNGLTDAWEGKNQKGYEHTGGLDATLMGARLYLPTWGQFTSTDPIYGGNPNPYLYPTDPINQMDLTGQMSIWARWSLEAAMFAVGLAEKPLASVCGPAVALCIAAIGGGLGVASYMLDTKHTTTSGYITAFLKGAGNSLAGAYAAKLGNFLANTKAGYKVLSVLYKIPGLKKVIGSILNYLTKPKR